MQDRVKPLAGVLNFRDFGGYATQGGGQVKPGALYRSAHFAEATDEDQAALDALGVGLVVDLRRPEERATEPNRWPGDGVQLVTNDEGLTAPPPHEAVASGNDWSVASVDLYMRHSYETYPFEPRYIALFSAFLQGLAADARPAVIHCAAGKDRTGSLAALTLRLLDVPADDVMADYLLTNTVTNLEHRIPLMRERIAARYGARPSDEALQRMMSVQESYLGAYFGAIEARFARLPDYVEAVLGVGAAEQAAIRARLVG
jgi:protein tyrosine/serine phosphatase